MPVDTQIPQSQVEPAPFDYPVPNSIEFRLKTVRATFTDNGATVDWLPTVELLSDSGHRIGTFSDQSVKVTAGDDADVTWFRRRLTTSAATPCPAPLTGAWYRVVAALNPLNCVAFGNGYWAIAGPGGALYYQASAPVGTWTSNVQGANVWNGVAYGNGYWAAVGSGGAVRYRATDPTGAWTANNQGGTTWKAVTYANGYWVAVGLSGVLRYRATDPTGAWTANNLANDLQGVAYGNGHWVATGTGKIYTTTDPTGAWTDVTPSPTPSWWRVTYAAGYWVAAASHVGVGTGANVWYATDPTGAWTQVFLEVGDAANLEGVAYGNGYFVTVGDSADMYYAAAPTIWTRNAQSGGSLLDVAHDNGYFVAVGPGSGGVGNVMWAAD